MTGLEFATIGVILVSHIITFVLGMTVGGFLVASYILQQFRKAQRELEKRLGSMPSVPPLSGDEWKEKKKITDIDENWLRRILERQEIRWSCILARCCYRSWVHRKKNRMKRYWLSTPKMPMAIAVTVDENNIVKGMSSIVPSDIVKRFVEQNLETLLEWMKKTGGQVEMMEI